MNSLASIEIRPVKSAREESDYSAFVQFKSDALLYHSLGYKTMIEALLDCKASYWAAYQNECVVGILPTVEKEGPYGKVINSLPFYGSHGGILASNDEARASLLNHYNAQATQQGVFTSTLIENFIVPEPIPPLYDLIENRISQVTPLISGEESALFEQIDSTARRNIRKAESSGVSVSVENEQLDFLYKTHIDSMTIIGGRAKPEAFFRRLPEFFVPDKDYRVWAARREGRLIAALLVFYASDTVEYFTPVTIVSERNCQPMAAILKDAMLHAGRAGYRQWNWGGTWLTQDGVYRFKKKWGAQDGSYRYFVKVNDSSVFDMSHESLLATYSDFYVIPFDKLRETL